MKKVLRTICQGGFRYSGAELDDKQEEIGSEDEELLQHWR
jgi:hypothetical protein